MQITTQSAPRSRQITTPTPHHSIFTGQVLFLTPNQQCQSSDNTNRVSTAPYDHNHHCYSEQANILSDKSGEESFAAAFHNVVQSSTDNNRTSTNKTFTQTTPHCVTLQCLQFTAACTTDCMTTAGCTTGWVNYAKERSQAALERSGQDARDIIRLTRRKAVVWTVDGVARLINISFLRLVACDLDKN